MYLCFNWKSNCPNLEFDKFTQILKGASHLDNLHNQPITPDTIFPILFPTFCQISQLSKEGLVTGGQDVSQYEDGAYTGEISASTLGKVGCSHVIVGHSERRQLFSETDDIIRDKIQQAIKSNLKPILCIGENLRSRERGAYLEDIQEQLQTFSSECIVAYEPVWSIGTGKVPKNSEISEIRNFIQKQTSHETRVLYGGSVKSHNIEELLQSGVDGFLIGGSSLVLSEVESIISICRNFLDNSESHFQQRKVNF